MSREQWGHGYWKGVEDAQSGTVKSKFPDEVKYWIAMMCSFNEHKDYDHSLYRAGDLILNYNLSWQYAKRIYNYILNNNYYDFRPGRWSWCYVSGLQNSKWNDDYFVLPVSDYGPEEWCIIIDEFREEWGWFKNNAKL